MSNNFSDENGHIPLNKSHSTSSSSSSSSGSSTSGSSTPSLSSTFIPASVTWHNVNVWAKPPMSFMDAIAFKTLPHGTQIIKNVSGKIKAGSTLAIMGASGSGKTTLLNVLNCRNLSNFHVDGVIRINDRLADIDMITSMSAYVQQEDMFLPTLTVREHLVFQAMVRIPSSVSEDSKIARIDQVMQELGLDKCADTRVGGSRFFKGISGGELKRLSFAAEVLTNPSIMFCDEPTSGLDSFMAANLVSIINKMAQLGRTIICTIHQPSSETFQMFQNLLLLADGRVAYFGEIKSAIQHFATIGHQCPENYNPADFFVHELAVVPGKEMECRKKINRICDYFERSIRDRQNSDSLHSLGSSTFSSQLRRQKRQSRYKTNRWQQYMALTWRSHLTVIREPALTYVRLSQALMNSIILGLIFFSQNYDQRGVWNINGALFLLIVNMTMQNAFAVINVFCSELPIFIREHNNGMYTVDAYFVCKNLAEIPIFVCIPIIFVTIYYYTLNLYPSFDSYLYCMLIAVIISACGVSFGYLISCLCRNTDVALSFGPPLIMPFQLLGGFFLNTHSIPKFLRWTKWISWFYYGFDALAVNQWRNVEILDCVDISNSETIATTATESSSSSFI
ncbi:ABC-2 type transporter [Dermatophagoides pteronyssinus]|uniref:ABC-2 type transporter n=1 Tax=Dermatophagoides pteronyssinus TaxID=6956 RepID=A0ABQ8J947_DERPT|nr:ABC-2 type transporter [Dermatophagoides pteronyssinus]